MARVKFVEGVQCKQCGEIATTNNGACVNIFTPELCQHCGAHIMDKDIDDKSFVVSECGRSVIVKETHKLFTTTYEVVRENRP